MSSHQDESSKIYSPPTNIFELLPQEETFEEAARSRAAKIPIKKDTPQGAAKKLTPAERAQKQKEKIEAEKKREDEEQKMIAEALLREEADQANKEGFHYVASTGASQSSTPATSKFSRQKFDSLRAQGVAIADIEKMEEKEFAAAQASAQASVQASVQALPQSSTGGKQSNTQDRNVSQEKSRDYQPKQRDPNQVKQRDPNNQGKQRDSNTNYQGKQRDPNNQGKQRDSNSNYQGKQSNFPKPTRAEQDSWEASTLHAKPGNNKNIGNDTNWTQPESTTSSNNREMDKQSQGKFPRKPITKKGGEGKRNWGAPGNKDQIVDEWETPSKDSGEVHQDSTPPIDTQSAAKGDDQKKESSDSKQDVKAPLTPDPDDEGFGKKTLVEYTKEKKDKEEALKKLIESSIGKVERRTETDSKNIDLSKCIENDKQDKKLLKTTAPKGVKPKPNVEKPKVLHIHEFIDKDAVLKPKPTFNPRSTTQTRLSHNERNFPVLGEQPKKHFNQQQRSTQNSSNQNRNWHEQGQGQRQDQKVHSQRQNQNAGRDRSNEQNQTNNQTNNQAEGW